MARAAATAQRFSSTPGDAAFLSEALPRLPGVGDDNDPVTVDLNGQLALPARGASDSKIVEVLLSQSEVTGRPVRFVTNRDYLARALNWDSWNSR